MREPIAELKKRGQPQDPFDVLMLKTQFSHQVISENWRQLAGTSKSRHFFFTLFYSFFFVSGGKQQTYPLEAATKRLPLSHKSAKYSRLVVENQGTPKWQFRNKYDNEMHRNMLI